MIIEKKKTVYVAHDGSEFQTLEEAKQYDANIADNRLRTLLRCGNIRLADKEGDELETLPACWRYDLVEVWMRFVNRGALVDFMELVNDHYATEKQDVILRADKFAVRITSIDLSADTSTVDPYIDTWILTWYDVYSNRIMVCDTVKHQTAVQDKLKHIASE